MYQEAPEKLTWYEVRNADEHSAANEILAVSATGAALICPKRKKSAGRACTGK